MKTPADMNEQEADAELAGIHRAETLLRDMKRLDPARYRTFVAELRGVLAISEGIAAMRKAN